VAKKRKRKRGRLKAVVVFVLTPIIIWIFAFLVWFHWEDITKLSSKESAPRPAPPQAAKKPERSGSPSHEKILEEDRQRLDDILRKRQ
jgi:cytoskeletal protein RodZ